MLGMESAVVFFSDINESDLSVYDSNWNESDSDEESLNDTRGYVCLQSFQDDSMGTLVHFQKFFIPLVYTLVFILGCLGNSLVLLILIKFRRSRSTTENFLLHLALADLLMLVTFPFAITESVAGWVFGSFLCKFVGVINRINFFCSSLLLGCISVDRYIAIIHAIHTFRSRRLVAVHLPCFGVWALCFLLSMPNLFVLGIQENGNVTTCTYHQSHFPSNGWWQTGRFLNHIVGFLLPLSIMGFCYAHIVAALCRSPRLEKKKAVRLAIVVTGVFLLCWTPYNVTVFIDTLDQLGLVHNCQVREELPIAITVTEFLGYVHCCLNPILYAFVGVKFRNDALRILRRAGCLSSLMPEVSLNFDRKSSATDSENGTVMYSF
ncbi:C-X-C chemokine receptor type 5 [Xenopus tropicalis]|uniref:C-X-C chemokine receptor type 5 n=1 Tax=Xenopus tropicalis TaxID=8364 RepID=A0A803JSF1_XENTR|nr:C-X-C chemokine receptor type 5 [Xenopus tropicalis]